MGLFVCFLIAAMIVHTLKIHSVDRQYAKQGLTPPGYRLIDKWLDGRIKRGEVPAGTKPTPYGCWAYLKQRWCAMWEDLGERHAAQRAEDKAKRTEAKVAGLPVPAGTGWRDRASKYLSWQWFISGVPKPEPMTAAKEPELQVAAASVQQHGSTGQPAGVRLADVMPAPDTTGPAPNDGPRIACEHCGQTLTEKDHEWVHPSSAGCPRQPAPTDTDIDVPLQENTTNEGEPPMTQPTSTPTLSGEVTGTRSAIVYLNAMADAHASHAGNEGFLTSLGTMEVGAGDIAKVRAAMEASQNAAAMWRAAADSMQSNNANVREAYANSPDAANKAAQLNE